ncbi:hypothetical protein [Mesorhizobium sp. ORS 3428]|uniref:hypothetical protein n=1 Tax=Mesorhizobium sp. ORS 3428 TaxID=540997 RepID=UPI0008DAEB96|nr:hypothetical protein [Mesorhizobium sp. ORS 3428]OHV86833.1 hypothetical protein ORS3428_06510 [Mesorhizobium sp. ORS 3428]
MNWPHLRPGDIAGILFMAVLLCLVVLGLLLVPKQGRNFGLGPEWKCAPSEQGNRVCVRLLDKQAPSKEAPSEAAPK